MMRVFLAGLCATVERVIADVPRQPPPSPVMPYAECDAGQQCGACLMAIPAEECPRLDANNYLVDADGKRIYIISCPNSANYYHQYGSTYYLGQLCYHYTSSEYRSCGSARHVRRHATPVSATAPAPRPPHPALALCRAASSRLLLCGRHVQGQQLPRSRN